jgi:hypothetical protein
MKLAKVVSSEDDYFILHELANVSGDNREWLLPESPDDWTEMKDDCKQVKVRWDGMLS